MLWDVISLRLFANSRCHQADTVQVAYNLRCETSSHSATVMLQLSLRLSAGCLDPYKLHLRCFWSSAGFEKYIYCMLPSASTYQYLASNLKLKTKSPGLREYSTSLAAP